MAWMCNQCWSSAPRVYPLLRHNKALCQFLSPIFSPCCEYAWIIDQLVIYRPGQSRWRFRGDADGKVEKKREKGELGDGWGGLYDLSLWANYEHDPRDLRSLCLAFSAPLLSLFHCLSNSISRPSFWCSVTMETFTYTTRCREEPAGIKNQPVEGDLGMYDANLRERVEERDECWWRTSGGRWSSKHTPLSGQLSL